MADRYLPPPQFARVKHNPRILTLIKETNGNLAYDSQDNWFYREGHVLRGPRKIDAYGHPAVELTKPSPMTNGITDMLLMWIEDRNQWLAFQHDHHYTTEPFWDDFYFSGPYKLSAFHKDVLRQAYGLNGEFTGDVSTLPPSQLEQIADNIN